MDYTGEDAKFHAGYRSLQRLTKNWAELYSMIVATLLNQEEIVEKRILTVVILLGYRTQVMEALLNLSSLLFLHAKTDEVRQQMGRIVELVDDEVEKDFNMTISAQFLN